MDESAPDKLDKKPEGFGYKSIWLAARHDFPQTVAAALALKNVVTCGWKYGVAQSYGDGKPLGQRTSIFITPPMSNWVFATGSVLGALCDKPLFFPTFIESLSQRLNGAEVQFFQSHRIVELHSWGRACGGKLLRAYSYFGERGETLCKFGEFTEAERELGFNFFDERCAEAKTDKYWERRDLRYPDEECVHQLAQKWSVAPMDFDQIEKEVDTGLLGDIDKETLIAGITPYVLPEIDLVAAKNLPWWKF
jgi:hypothetical protein